MEPFEIIAAPADVYLAAVGTAFPDVSAVPGGDWTKLGTAGNKNQTEDGVTVEHEQTNELVHVAGRTGPVKALRTREGLKLSLTIMDLSIEVYRRALNDNTLTDTAAGAGTAGIRSVSLHRGLSVSTYALLLKAAASAYGSGFSMQYQVPRVFVDGNPSVAYVKGQPAGLMLDFTALEDPDDDNFPFGKLVMQDADAA